MDIALHCVTITQPHNSISLYTLSYMYSDPNLSGGNTRESYLSSGVDQTDGGSHEPRGNDQASIQTPYPLTKSTPIVVDVPKESAFLGKEY